MFKFGFKDLQVALKDLNQFGFALTKTLRHYQIMDKRIVLKLVCLPGITR